LDRNEEKDEMRNQSSSRSLALLFLLLFVLSPSFLSGCGNPSHVTPVTPEPSSVSISTRNALIATPIDKAMKNDETLFLSKYCPVSLNVSDGWSVQEYGPGEPGSSSMEAPTIELIKDQYRLAIICYVKEGNTVIGPGGRGAGEPVTLPEIPILDKVVPGQATVWEGAMVSVLYAYQSEVLTIYSDLGPNPYSSNSVPYPEFDITEAIVTEVAQLIATLALTEALDISSPPSSTDDPRVILPMGDFYHSQLVDIDLPNACAPTAGFIVLDYLKRETTLDEVAELLRKVDPEHGGYDPSCERNVVCTSPMTLAQQLSQEYQLTIHTRQGWTLDAAYEAIDRGHPIVADILWRLEGPRLGHFVVIFGVDREEKLIFYHDPLDGESMVSTWQVFSERWAGPVDVGDPTFLQGFQFWGMEVYSDEWETYPSP
jgi:uncharacterized protein YvpB